MDLQTPDDIAVSVRNIGKRYHRYANMRDRLMHQFFPDRVPGGEEIWALQDISFDIRRGESVAIIGRNGGGKSTLLQILTGTLTPTQGDVQVNGRVCALLELGSGFNPEYSGRDNVMMNGLLLGLSRQQILDRFDEIADFAEIGDAIERPVKTYSSGMMLRLAFAVQVLADPDILIIDEALSVGDFFFQQKCLTHIRGLRQKGVTLLFVSHDMGAVRDTCERGILLRKGRIDFDGENLVAIRRYLQNDDQSGSGTLEIPTPSVGTIPSEKAENELWRARTANGPLRHIESYNEDGVATSSFRMNSKATFDVHVSTNGRRQDHIHLEVRNKANQIVTSIGTLNLGVYPPQGTTSEYAILSLTMRMAFEAGQYSLKFYSVEPGDEGNSGKVIDETDWIGPIQISWDYSAQTAPFLGMFGPEASAEFANEQKP